MTRTIPIPFGEAVTIDARPDQPKWLFAVDDDLHMVERVPSGEPLYAGRVVLVTQPVTVREPNGRASRVRVASEQPKGARAHDPMAA